MRIFVPRGLRLSSRRPVLFSRTRTRMLRFPAGKTRLPRPIRLNLRPRGFQCAPSTARRLPIPLAVHRTRNDLPFLDSPYLRPHLALMPKRGLFT